MLSNVSEEITVSVFGVEYRLITAFPKEVFPASSEKIWGDMNVLERLAS
jgi:hypothetical protein